MSLTKKKRARPAQITWYHKYLQREINKLFGWSPHRRDTRKLALVSKWPEELFRCELCKQTVGRKEIHCDHKVPRENVGEWDGWSNYIFRALDHGGPDGLQWICTTCHKVKTKVENADRRKARKKDDTKG